MPRIKKESALSSNITSESI